MCHLRGRGDADVLEGLALVTRVEKLRDEYSAALREQFADDLHHIGAASHWASRRDQARRREAFFEAELRNGSPGKNEERTTGV